MALSFCCCDLKPVAVIGAGTMGNGIAHVFAQNGAEVVLVDISQDMLDRAVKARDLATANTVLRFLPALNVTEAEIDRAVGIVHEACADVGQTSEGVSK